MKKIEDVLKSETLSEVEFYLDYYEMIEEVFKSRNSPPSSFYKEKKMLEERLKKLCKMIGNDGATICSTRLGEMN